MLRAPGGRYPCGNSCYLPCIAAFPSCRCYPRNRYKKKKRYPCDLTVCWYRLDPKTSTAPDLQLVMAPSSILRDEFSHIFSLLIFWPCVPFLLTLTKDTICHLPWRTSTSFFFLAVVSSSTSKRWCGSGRTKGSSCDVEQSATSAKVNNEQVREHRLSKQQTTRYFPLPC